jgi:hypothetical protein
MRTHLFLYCMAFVFSGGFSGGSFASGSNAVLAFPQRAADSGFSADKGKFRILQQGNEAGSEEFDLEPAGNAWVLQDQTVIRVAGSPEMRTTGELHIAADGTPQRYTWSAEGSKKASGVVDFQSGTAKTSITIPGGKQPIQQDFKFTSPRIAILDNNLYGQYAILARIYDWQASGKQTFPVLIPQDATPGSIDVEANGPQTMEGAHLEGLLVHTTDLKIQLYFDAKLRLVRLEVPSAKVVIVRQ